MTVLIQVGKRATPFYRDVPVLQAPLLLVTIPYGTGVFPQFLVAVSRGKPFLYGGIFTQRFCLSVRAAGGRGLHKLLLRCPDSSAILCSQDHTPFPHGATPHLLPIHCLPAPTCNPSFIKGLITLLNHSDGHSPLTPQVCVGATLTTEGFQRVSGASKVLWITSPFSLASSPWGLAELPLAFEACELKWFQREWTMEPLLSFPAGIKSCPVLLSGSGGLLQRSPSQ